MYINICHMKWDNPFLTSQLFQHLLNNNSIVKKKKNFSKKETFFYENRTEIPKLAVFRSCSNNNFSLRTTWSMFHSPFPNLQKYNSKTELYIETCNVIVITIIIKSNVKALNTLTTWGNIWKYSSTMIFKRVLSYK